RGDLDHKIEIPEGDEIGDLARAFSYMTTALKENQRRLAARMREIVALHDAGRAVSSVIEVDQVLSKVVDSVAGVLHLRVCALWLVDGSFVEGERPDLVLGAVRAKRDDMRVISSESEAAELVKPLMMLAQDVAESRGTLRFDDMSSHPQHSARAVEATIDGSLIAAVLERKGSVVGVIVVGRGAGARVFSDEDANLLSAFADQAATAIENANLYAKVRKFNEELEAKVALRTNELQTMNNELGRAIYELKETQAQLTLSERLAGLGQLVAGVAHEINSPSAAIRGTADTLADTIKRLTLRQTRLQTIVGDAARAAEIVTLYESVAPGLAEKRRVPPAQIRRQARLLKEELKAAGVPADTAVPVAKRLAELDVDSELLDDLLPYLRVPLEEGRFVIEYLSDYVHVHRSTRTIQDAIRRIQRIVGSLKSYSHLDQNAARALSDVHEGIENTLVILEYQFSRGISVHRNYAALPAVPVFVDELNQVWTNLIHNAVQALGEKGEIEIETLVINDGIAVRIIDNGPGISDEIMKRIFDPFFTTKASGEGTGLGLGIVQQIVEKHQGKVRCTSGEGRTCFEVWLPVSVPVASA
ncbi:MAG: GAF domain-containing protein, partial [Kofleriaceae bacterium]|nr:GAF domain-containing protein [Kofleriaceae bacterium]